MNVCFRVDASLAIGTGHVMRCLALADALARQGARCTFISRLHPGHLIELVRERGHVCHALPMGESQVAAPTVPAPGPPVHFHWLGASLEEEVHAVAACLQGQEVQWLVVDHYALDAAWEGACRPHCRHLMVVDDLADRPHACDLLQDQNLGRTPSDYRPWVPSDCELHLGAQHALLRPEFAALRDRSLQRRATRPPLQRVLITMGGVDAANATGLVLASLTAGCLPASCRITVVMGPHAPWLEAVRALAATLPWAVEVLVNVRNMPELMMDSDLAIGAAGSTSWERCVLGLPSVLVVQADNQRFIADALDRSGAAVILDLANLAVTLPPTLVRLREDVEALPSMSQAAAAVSDGQGALMLAQRLMQEIAP